MGRQKLLDLASEAGIVDRSRMKNAAIIEALVLSRIYRALPESPGIIHGLSRKDLILLCALNGKEADGNARKADLVHEMETRISRMQGDVETVETVPAMDGFDNVEQSLPGQGETVDNPLAEFSGLPQSYGKTRVVLLPVHPDLVHVYWEVANSDVKNLRNRLRRGSSRPQAVLRFFEVGPTSLDNTFFDVQVELEARQWYVPLWSPQQSYYVDLGLKTGGGRFLPLCRSMVIETPPAWPSLKGEERYVSWDNQGKLIEAEIPFPEALPRAAQSAASNRFSARTGSTPLKARGSSEQIGRHEATPGFHLVAAGQNRSAIPEEPYNDQRQREPYQWKQGSPSSRSATAITFASEPDLTEMCEQSALLGTSSKMTGEES